MKTKTPTISIIGYGRFAKVLLRLLGKDFQITIYNRSNKDYSKEGWGSNISASSSLKEIYKTDVIFYCVPIPTFKDVIKTHKKYMNSHNLLIDVLSVKVHPKKVFDKYLKGTNIQAILTHPMFGPDSAKESFEKLPVVINQYKADDNNYTYWKNFFLSKKLNVIEMSASKHDQLASKSQGVAHLIGRILKEYKIKPTPIDTLGAIKLQEVMDQTCHDTWELFEGLQNFNPYTTKMRKSLNNAYIKIESKLNRTNNKTNSKTIKIGIQGGRGSFNEQALIAFSTKYPAYSKLLTKYLYTTKNVLRELDQGNIDYGLFAMHNSVGGIVDESIQAIADYKFKIVKEINIKIQHYLMKPKNVDISEIDTIMTHPQVLKQCQSTLANKYPHLKLTSGKGDLIDHANVAKAMSENKIPRNIAVMGAKILSEIYDLDIIEGNLQDNKENVTNFLLVKKFY